MNGKVYQLSLDQTLEVISDQTSANSNGIGFGWRLGSLSRSLLGSMTLRFSALLGLSQ